MHGWFLSIKLSFVHHNTILEFVFAVQKAINMTGENMLMD